MTRFVTFTGVHDDVAVNAEKVLYVAPLPETGDCWLYFGGKGEAAEEGQPAVIVVQVKGKLADVVAKLEGSMAGAPKAAPGEDGKARDAGHGSEKHGEHDERPPLQAAAEDEPPLLPAPEGAASKG